MNNEIISAQTLLKDTGVKLIDAARLIRNKTYRRRKVDSKYTRHITEGGKYKSTTLLL